MVDHLSHMGVQRWQLRDAHEFSREKQQIEDTDYLRKIENPDAIVVSEKQSLTSSDTVNFNATQPFDSFSAYAATSVKLDHEGRKQYWLWVVPQASLPAKELQLLDKIVAATQANWDFEVLADNYLSERELNDELLKPLSAVVVFGNLIDQWPHFFNHNLYQTSHYFMGVSLQNMLEDMDKKRQTWRALQALML